MDLLGTRVDLHVRENKEFLLFDELTFPVGREAIGNGFVVRGIETGRLDVKTHEELRHVVEQIHPASVARRGNTTALLVPQGTI